MHLRPPTKSTNSLRHAFCLTFALTAISCASDDLGPPPADDSPKSASAKAIGLVGAAQIALTDDDRVALAVGDLGSSERAVLEAFTAAPAEIAKTSESVDELGFTHSRFVQTIDGLRIVGGEIRISRNPAGEIISASGVASQPSDVVASPSLSAESAREVALASSPGADAADLGELVYVAGSNLRPTLAWQFVVTGKNGAMPRHDLVFVDAVNGSVAARHPKIHTALNRETYDGNNSTDEANFTLERVEGQGATGDAEIDTAHNSAGDVHKCLSDLFGRDSYNGAGADLLSLVRFDVNLQNAFWTGDLMVYGDGFAEADVATHEIGHGVTEFTAGLIYQDESGALNEGASDILMAICDVHKAGAIDSGTWIVGEDLPIGAIRSMEDPTADGFSRDHYSTRFTGPEDQGGVHFNSGIFNLYFVLLTEGGNHPRRPGEQTVSGIGIAKAAQIYYRALSVYMTQSTNFAAARLATEQAARDLFGAGSGETIAVAQAWFAVGVGGAPPAPVCGDGLVDAGETCDDGNTAAGDGCDSVCAIEPDPVCGDGQIDSGEACDDGNTAAGDGCSAICTVEPNEPDDEGGCQIGSSSAPVGAGWLLLLVALAFIRRRRRA